MISVRTIKMLSLEQLKRSDAKKHNVNCPKYAERTESVQHVGNRSFFVHMMGL